MNNDVSLLTATDSPLMTAIRHYYGDAYADAICASIEAQKASIEAANAAADFDRKLRLEFARISVEMESGVITILPVSV